MISRYELTPGGPTVSRIAYGAWRLAEDPLGTSVARVRAKIDACLQVGMTTIDHANIYGGYSCEGLFGQVLKETPRLRDQLEIVSKCGINARVPLRPDVRVKHYDATAIAIVAEVDRSLRELCTDHLDLLLIHRPDWLTSAEETAAGLTQVMQSGKVRAVGVSNYSTRKFDLLQSYLSFPLVTNQIELSLLCLDPICNGILDQCQSHRRHPMAWSPLGGGRMFDPNSSTARRISEEVRRQSQNWGIASVEQLAMAWILRLPSQPIVVIGTNRPERIAAAAAADTMYLSRQDWYALWQAAEGHEVP